MSRQFEFKPAIRSSVPLLIGLFGASGSGKTFTALRLATGIQRVFPGDILFIDTESRRALHYSNLFQFKHMEFKAPFGSLDYLEALKYAKNHNPSVIVVDSFSLEHEGEMGMLDYHEKELDRLAGNDYKKRQTMTMLAWSRPKADRRKLINGLLQLNSNFIFCFRAKETSKPVKDPVTKKTTIENFGFLPIAGSEFVYEMTINCMLPPHSNGVPEWSSENKGEAMMMKLPEQFKHIFNKPGIQLTEDIGEQLALWAKGDDKIKPVSKPVNQPKSEPVNNPVSVDYGEFNFSEPKKPTLRDSFEDWFNGCQDLALADRCRDTCEKNGWTDDVINWAITQMRNSQNG